MSQQQGFVYKITCNQTGDVYIGSTEDMKERMRKHKDDCKRWVADKTSFTTSFPIILKDDYIENVLEVVELKGATREARKDELRKREQYWLDIYRNLPKTKDHVVNKNDAYSGFDSVEEYHRAYREKNRDRIIAEKREFYYKNRDRLLAEKKEYYENHGDRIRAQKKEKITCECGDTICRSSIARHRRTQRHIDRLQEQQDRTSDYSDSSSSDQN
jgi:predicted GIY-YIG superfamily endonuclease